MEKNYKIFIPLSIIIAGLCVAGAFIYVNRSGPFLLTEDMAGTGQKAINYINENLLPPDITASLVDISDSGSVYKIRLSIEGNEFDSYVSKDGEFLFPDGYEMSRPPATGLEPEEVPAVAPTTDLPEEDLKEFIGCLSRSGFLIYGANWCGFTVDVVSMLGGWELVEPIYVECSEKPALCEEKEIAGYPTILLNDREFPGARRIEDFALHTGCPLPE